MIGRCMTLLLVLCAVAHSRIEQVVSLFRHGARYSSGYYSTSNDDVDKFPEELTAIGMRQQFNLGKMLRKDYIEAQPFLSDNYAPGQIKVYSTDYNRTLMSAQIQLLGLYPLGKGRKMPEVDPEFHLPPYTSQTDSNETEYSTPGGYSTFGITVDPSVLYRDCPRYDTTVEQNVNYYSLTYKEMNLTYYPFLIKLSTVFNVPMKEMNFSKVLSIYDNLTVYKYLGYPLPEQITMADYYNMQHLYQWFTHIKHSRGLALVVNDQKFRSIINDFNGRISGASELKHKWRMLSAHDTDINPLLYGLNISSPECVEEVYRRGYTNALNCEPNSGLVSSIIVELHSDTKGEYEVKVRHNGKYVYLCERKEVACKWQEFEKRLKDKLISDQQYYSICGAPDSDEETA